MVYGSRPHVESFSSANPFGNILEEEGMRKNGLEAIASATQKGSRSRGQLSLRFFIGGPLVFACHLVGASMEEKTPGASDATAPLVSFP